MDRVADGCRRKCDPPAYSESIAGYRIVSDQSVGTSDVSRFEKINVARLLRCTRLFRDGSFATGSNQLRSRAYVRYSPIATEMVSR
jgi:hypothetical protein